MALSMDDPFQGYQISRFLMNYDNFKEKINKYPCWTTMNGDNGAKKIIQISKDKVVFDDNTKTVGIITEGTKENGYIVQFVQSIDGESLDYFDEGIYPPNSSSGGGMSV